MLTAVICAGLSSAAYAAEPNTAGGFQTAEVSYSYSLENGTVTSTIVGNGTKTSFFTAPSGNTGTAGYVVNMPYGYVNTDGEKWTETNTVLNIGNEAGDYTSLDSVIGGVRGTHVAGNKEINVYKNADVDTLIVGYAAMSSAQGPGYVYSDGLSDLAQGVNSQNSAITANIYGEVGMVMGNYVDANSFGNLSPDWSIKEAININVIGGKTGVIYGSGYYNGIVDNNISIKVSEGGETGTIYAGPGTWNDARRAYVLSTDIQIADGTVKGNIFGGGYYYPDLPNRKAEVKENTLIEVIKGSVEGNVYGAGNHDIIGGNTKVILTGGTIGAEGENGTISGGNVYAGGIASTIEGNTEVVIKGEGSDVKGTIYGGNSEGGTIKGDKILAFDSTDNATIEKYLGTDADGTGATYKVADFNAIGFHNMEVDIDDEKYNRFGDLVLYVGGKGDTGTAKVTSDQGRDFKKLVVNEGGLVELSGEGKTHTSKSIYVYGGKLVASNTTVTCTSANLQVGNDGDGAKLVIKDGAKFTGGYNNTWLYGGSVEVTGEGSTLNACAFSTSSSQNNYRTLLGVTDDRTGETHNELEVNVSDGGTFYSAATQLVTNYNDNTEVSITVDGSGSVFKQAAEAVRGTNHFIGTTGEWGYKELVLDNGSTKEAWCDMGSIGKTSAANASKKSITYICDSGTDKYGAHNGAVDNAHTTITTKNGGAVVIESELTYVGSSADKAAGVSDKSATFNVEDSASSMSFQGMEIYTNAQVNNKGGKFSATNVNVRAGGNLTFNVNTASAVMTADTLTVYDGGRLSFVQPAAAVGASLAMEAPATTTVTLDSELVLLAGSTLVLDPGMLVNLGYNDLTIQDGATIVLSNAAAALTMTNAEVEAMATTLFQTAGTFTALDENGNIKADGIAIVEFNGSLVGISSGNGVANVPEPTTATLSLLALAGLCARRRRK